MEEHQVRRLQCLLIVSSIACFLLLILAAVDENVLSPWRQHQRDYADGLAEVARAEGTTPITEPIRLKQNYLPTLGRVDRCVSCHLGIDNPKAAQFDQPLTTHPGDLLSHHPPDKFGCSICHQGQGRATVLPDAHGLSSHWPEPLLAGDLVYTACGRCHYENDLYGGSADLYGNARPVEQVTQGELTSHVPGAENIARGKRLVIEHGCLGCHPYRGRGGTLGPEITHVGDKTVHDFDFTHVHGEHSVLGWMTAHFESPESVVPGTLMPDMGLSTEDSRDLAAYMISLKRKSAPASYTPVPQALDRAPANGLDLYLMYCSSCHGADGVGAIARSSQGAEDPDLEAIDRPRELLTPSLRNGDTLAVASDDYLRYIIQHGRSRTGMPAWADNGGLSPEEIDRLVVTLRGWQADGPAVDSIAARRGNPRFGRALYRSRCVGCHGVDGRGGIGVSLRSPSFLAVASDEFLRDAIIQGRTNSAMPSWTDLAADEVSDLIAYLRSWQPEPPATAAVLARLESQPATPETLHVGRVLYRANCANCHGKSGEGALGPSLRTDEFLSLADNVYLSTAIVEGRPDTAMPAWNHLSVDDAAALIQYLRAWNENRHRQLEPYLARTDWDRGRILFEGSCSGCHGKDAEGGVGPQLANPTFLATATDAMLREWISFGKLGTPMLGFLRGQQGVTEMTPAQIDDVVTFLRYQQGTPRKVTARPGVGIVAHGEETYAGACAGCHGSLGEGGVGSALSNPEFLRSASDGYLAATITLGRDGTEMLPMGAGLQGVVEMNAEDIANVVAFLRNWEHQPPFAGVPSRRVMGADPHDGKALYIGFCAGCHGRQGDEGWAPELNNPEFLEAATDGFLQATIARGRSGTAMRSFGKGGGGVAPLTGEQIDNIVNYMRGWQRMSE